MVGRSHDLSTIETSLKAFSLTIASQVFQYLGKKNTILMKNSVEVNVNHFILFLLR